jgi:hypothetical protein
MKNMAAEIIGDVVLVLHNSESPDDNAWGAYIQQCMEAGRIANGDYRRIKNLVFTDGGGPNATQRQQSIDALQKFTGVKESKVAVVTNSMIARGIITVASWMNMTVKAFSPEKAEDAGRFLGIPAEQMNRFAQAIERLSTNLSGGIPKSATPLVSARKRPGIASK